MAAQQYELESAESIVSYRLQLQAKIAEAALYLSMHPNSSPAHQAYYEVISEVLMTDEALRERCARAPLVERTMEDAASKPVLRLITDTTAQIN